MRLPLAVLFLISAAPWADAQTLLRSVNGPVAGAQFGRVSLVVPDQNGDGSKDVLVGAPAFNSGRGAVYCVSGTYLANGSGAAILWAVTPPTNPGDQFGYSIANVGDQTFDGNDDFIVGQPGSDLGGQDSGAVRLLRGISHSVTSERYTTVTGARFGTAVAATASVSGDARREVAVGAPSGGLGYVFILNSIAVTSGGVMGSTETYASIIASGETGTSLASGIDFNGDGFEELIVGSGGIDVPGATNCGEVSIVSVAPNGFFLKSYSPSVAGERFGQSVSFGQDFDGDGTPDILVGAPNYPDIHGHEVGRIVALSGRRLFLQTPPYEIYAIAFGTAQPPSSHSVPTPNFHFGASVHACADLTGDGVGEILAGAPDYFTPGLSSGFNFRGMVRVFSGASGAQLATITGATTDRLGDGLAGAVFDFDGDGFREFALCGSLSDAGGTDSGVLRSYRIFPLAVSTYCVGKPNSLGCVPAIAFNGVPSASSGAPFMITVNQVLNQKNGLLFYSHAPSLAPFQGGTKCVASPSLRTPSQNSGGSTAGNDCSGSFSVDFNAWIASGADPSLGTGSEVFAQLWSRDPASPSHTSLSNALRFVVNP